MDTRSISIFPGGGENSKLSSNSNRIDCISSTLSWGFSLRIFFLQKRSYANRHLWKVELKMLSRHYERKYIPNATSDPATECGSGYDSSSVLSYLYEYGSYIQIANNTKIGLILVPLLIVFLQKSLRSKYVRILTPNRLEPGK